MRSRVVIAVVFALILPAAPTAQPPQLPDSTRIRAKKDLQMYLTELNSRAFTQNLKMRHPGITDSALTAMKKEYRVQEKEELKRWTPERLQSKVDSLREDIGLVYMGADVEDVNFAALFNSDILEAAKSVVAIVKRDSLKEENGVWHLGTRLFVDIHNGFGPLCSFEPNFGTPCTDIAGTGFLIADSIIATAGHVVKGVGPAYTDFLNSVYFVFDFVMQSNTARTTFTDHEVFVGKSVLTRRNDAIGDWALIELARKPDRDPLPYRKEGQPEDNTPVYMIGHPNGLTQKCARRAAIQDNTACFYFTTNLDSYPYNSGSPVIRADSLLVEGILVGDIYGFEWYRDCYLSKVYTPQMGQVSASVTRTTVFAGSLADRDSFTVYCKIPTAELRTVDEEIVVLESDDIKRLQYNNMGVELILEGGFYQRYFPGPGDVWEIVVIQGESRMKMQKVCYP
jgi:hypothetical protein